MSELGADEEFGKEKVNLVQIRSKTNLKKSKSQDLLDDLIENEKKISSLSDLNKADHIVFLNVGEKKYSHTIVSEIDDANNVIEVIYYDGVELQCSLDEYLVDCDEKCELESNGSKTDLSCKKKGVKKSKIKVNFQKLEIYRVDYEILQEKCLTVEETLEKAEQFVGQAKYNIFANNDEHFAIYCKTGKAAKLFIINPSDLTAKNLIGKSIPSKIATNLAQEGAQVLLVNTAKHIATKFPRTAASTVLPVAAEAAGSAIGAGIEGVSMGYDIYKKHKEMKTGKITDTKFKKFVATRVTRGTMSVAGGVAGGIIGQMVIPIPVVGAMVGGLIGGIAGAAVGQGEGILLGELVEVIDNKIKEKKSNKQDATGGDLDKDKEALPKEEPKEVEKIPEKQPEPEILEPKYHVLSHLVFKFDRNLLKPENFAHLSDIKLELNEASNKASEIIIKNASQQINDKDYEIYVLNDSNEIITELNVENTFADDGSILKRKSLEAYSADQLPSDINVYFHLSDSDPNLKQNN